MLPSSPRVGGRSASRRPAQYPSQPQPRSRSASRPREKEREREPQRGAGRSVDYETATRSRDTERPQRSNTMRQIRPQRSMGSLPSSTRATPSSSSSRDVLPPMPQPYNARGPPPPKSAGPRTDAPSSYPRSNLRAGSTSSNASSSSSSSSGSSFLDRMRVRYPDSSQTSLELEQEQESPKGEASAKWYGSREWRAAAETTTARQGGAGSAARDWRNKNTDAATRRQDQTQGSEEETSYTTYGYSIWSRIATAANNLAENVNSAWATSNFSSSTEDVPGEETNLTKALKAYHLGKARSRAELPDWLFSEEERRGPSGSSSTSRRRQIDAARGYNDQRGEVGMPNTGRRGFRDAGGAAAASAPVSPTGRRVAAASIEDSHRWAVDDSAAGYEFGGGGGSKATNRLRALRDAKRQAALAGRGAQSFSGPATDSAPSVPLNMRSVAADADRSRTPYSYQPGGGAGERQERQVPKPRMGLPANPRRR